MFAIDSEGIVLHYPPNSAVDPSDSGTYVHTQAELAALIGAKPGEWAVKLWNQLPGVTPIHTPPGEPSAKFRNKQTAVERIWNKLAELYPDAILESDMPKAKEQNENPKRRSKHRARTPKAGKTTAKAENGRKVWWAEELTAELRKRFDSGVEFELSDVYKLIPTFQRRHKENHHIAARLRTTLAQDLRGEGVVKSIGKGKYRMCKP